MAHESRGRLVWNHSTHISGLIPILERLIKCEGIRTVTPAVISRSRSHCPKIKLKVSVPIRGGYKAIARQGKSVQEVFIITNLDKQGLEAAIKQAIR